MKAAASRSSGVSTWTLQSPARTTFDDVAVSVSRSDENSSRLDNGNALLCGITERQLNKLQLAQNAAARMLTRTRKVDHISPVLQRLHWLPVRYRIISNFFFSHMESPT